MIHFLASGFDTVECAYYLTPHSKSSLDFVMLMAERESLRQAKIRKPRPVRLGSEEFLLANHGTGSGYPFLLSNDWATVQCGEHNRPNFFVTYRSQALWHSGLEQLNQRFLAWADSVGMMQSRPERVSRVDAAFDYCIDEIDFDEDNFVVAFEKDVQYRANRKVQTFTFGAGGLVLRVYNKSDEIAESSDKTWFYPIWGGIEKNVWRIEWEVRKDILRRFGIRTLNDLFASNGDVFWAYSQENSLRIKTSDSNRSRWPHHPLWLDLFERVREMNNTGIIRECDLDKLLDERLTYLSISVYGYLKRIAAIHGLQSEQYEVSKDQAMQRLGLLVDRLHDPFSWENDVRRRMDEMRLGQ